MWGRRPRRPLSVVSDPFGRPRGRLICIPYLFFGTSPSHIGSAQGKLLIAMSTSNGERVNFHDHIVRDPQICNGEPTIRGTRVTLRTILASLAEGNSEDEILHSFPALRREDVWTVIAFAAASAEEDLPVPELPAI